MATDYKNTLNLPKTNFPMRAALPQREPAWCAAWARAKIYPTLLARRHGQRSFVLHDGPPFANGDAHMGHVLNMTLKDVVLKSRNMAGCHAPFVPGWDCHGLPIEHKVMKELAAQTQDADGGLAPVAIRERCAAMARKYIDIQRAQFQRLGLFGDWQRPYLTVDPAYEAAELRLFARLVDRGLVYQALRPVSWSTGCRTALAEAEVEYADRRDTAVYVAFALTPAAAARLNVSGDVSLIIWTTTPWTLPANLAVAAAPQLDYVIVSDGTQSFVLAAARLAAVQAVTGRTLTVTGSLKGAELVGLEYRHPFLPRTGQVYDALFVTADTGAGLVHIAPGHGQDDYQLGQKAGLPVLSPVDDRGCLTAECGVPELVGVYVFKANPVVVKILTDSGHLLASEEFQHSYPHCWRSKTPIVFRSVTQWFIKVDAFRADALAAIDQVEWVPVWGRNRIRGTVATRPDWCISRQRAWGVPVPVLYRADGQPVLDGALIRKIADLVARHGSNIWYEKSAAELCALLNVSDLHQGRDTLDVWIDSGSSHAAVLRSGRWEDMRFPADLYLEGSDQHRGWFQSSLCLAVAADGAPPFREVLTHGFVVDLDGKKLSKSNTYQKPTDLLSAVNQSGADILRLWVASQDYRDDMPFSDEIFKTVSDTYRSFRNALRILLANLADFDADRDKVADRDLAELDLYVLMKLQDLTRASLAAYEQYEFHQVYHLINRFCAADLSALYIDVTKDALYCDAANAPRRRAIQTVLHEIYETLTLLLAPIIPFTAEEAWQYLLDGQHGATAEGRLLRESVHLQLFPPPRDLPLPADFAARWEKILALRAAANEQLEQARRQKTIGKSLEAALTVSGGDFTAADRDLLADTLIVSAVELAAGDTLTVSVRRAEGHKCARCWKYHPALDGDLCPRCAQAVNSSHEDAKTPSKQN
ncbi:MAG: isoleucine--tRNA ligase [Verrucomicrobiales bacterium]|jgi:isoleucyl-tRNA synthetase|nr:isoleucine--tRNA ligase [Verrucomicrobiales bacterium]